MRRIISLLLLSSAAGVFGAEQLQFQSGTNHTALIELYTSEGCSSCPPAEDWFSKLKTHPRLWVDFVPAAFHVDYWDSLGWRDAFGAPEYSDRQRAYATGWKNRSIYTPGFVLDGKEWGSRPNRDDLPGASTRAMGRLVASSSDGKRWMLRLEPFGQRSEAVDFHGALLGFDLEVDVKAGENRGRKLQQDFVVLTLAQGRSKSGDNLFQAELSLDPSPRPSPKRLAVAAWVTRHNDLRPLEAVGGWLPLTKP